MVVTRGGPPADAGGGFSPGLPTLPSLPIATNQTLAPLMTILLVSRTILDTLSNQALELRRRSQNREVVVVTRECRLVSLLDCRTKRVEGPLMLLQHGVNSGAFIQHLPVHRPERERLCCEPLCILPAAQFGLTQCQRRNRGDVARVGRKLLLQ